MAMIKAVPSRVSLPDLDVRILDYWKEQDILRRSESERPDAPLFMLYEGPPTANGSPGIHHVLSRVFKDVMCRYKTMKGYRCLRKGGWDTHGLPVELEVEKRLGISTKREIEEYGIEEFNRKCRENVFSYVKEWETLTERIGFWVDMDDPYVTLDNDYIETGWWILKELWERNLIYQAMRGAPHCPRCETSLSSHEISLGYKEDTPDPSTYVKFRLTEPSPGISVDPNIPTYLLAWTTTPWTLPGNTALAVAADSEYALVEPTGERYDSVAPERLILATELLKAALPSGHRIIASFKGAELVGCGYQSLYSPTEYGVEIQRFVRQAGPGGGTMIQLEPANQIDHRVVSADFVSMTNGTGVVHIAPAFGDEDLGLGRERELAFVQPVDLQGNVSGDYPFAGKFVKEADDDILRDLADRDLLHRRDTYYHSYPFCWRCDTPILYYAKSAWYIRTSAYKDQMVNGNNAINWYPTHIREGRFGDWLRNNTDWAISRERYWGTPIPIWRCQDCARQVCIGSRAELKAAALPQQQGKIDDLDLHRPYVDSITLSCPVEDCSGEMRRTPEVMDCWFDSGAMPFAQWHYPFDNPNIADDGRFPADYICEAVDQTRGWFYSLHALSTLLTDQLAYRNVICLGHIRDGAGRKMSKSLGNMVEPNAVLDAHGADALRWYLFTAGPPGEPRNFSVQLVNETLRKVMLTLWNVYSFFTNYAAIDGFHPDQIPVGWRPEATLDRWILSELNLLSAQVDATMDAYDPTASGRRIQEFIDLLSNWYVRRSRRRFWKSESDADKTSAYTTLYTCLTTLTRAMAPLAPFIAEEIYLNLIRSVNPSAPDSVHLDAFPISDSSLIDEDLMASTRLAMQVASMGRAVRSKAGIKVRQPLSRVRIWGRRDHLELVRPQILEELNLKEMEVLEKGDGRLEAYQEQARQAAQAQASTQSKNGAELSHHGIYPMDNYWIASEPGCLLVLETEVTPELAQEGLARELAHRIQGLRRAANFDIPDRIVIYYQGPEAVAQVMSRHAAYISQETLSEELIDGPPPADATSASEKIEGMEVTLGVKRL